jgi:seryl-tRNA synthetase
MPWSVLKVLRENPDLMRENLRKRFMDPSLVDKFLRIDSEWRMVQTELNKLRHEHNVISSQIPKLSGEERDSKIREAKKLLEEIGEMEERLRELSEERKQVLDGMPSLLHESVPVGPDESYNTVGSSSKDNLLRFIKILFAYAVDTSMLSY